VRRCPYCGHRCHGRTCRYCADLAREEVEQGYTDSVPLMRDELREAVQATKGTEA